ncbi:hypothetical protein M422DRAFT_778290 [Sphaerobolus stellatus SS14]|uniref:Jacalin-type lectin domain-containing protein n=1 Tax=Sphaerobolus stellatus (strain SS14) TaxID=990650 RepID=A0A0C9VUY3_SPHS4|nr:hypothetical protein M422DRAFT_778290 [Sphaerobolus stellatus SS14]
MSSSTLNVALIQSPVFGGTDGKHFNDIQDVAGFPASLTIKTTNAISSIVVYHGGLVDGIQVTYNETGGTAKGTKQHGSIDNSLNKDTITFSQTQSIIAISGRAGTTGYGNRVIQLSFTVYDSSNGKMQVYGPYGNSAVGPAFHVTANGAFVGFSGFAVDSDLSIGRSADQGVPGGIYGLSFIDIAYRSA